MADNDDHRPAGELLIYQVADAQGSLQVRLEGESVWLSQRSIAELYGVEVQTVNEHIVNIYADNELETERTIRNFRIVQTEGSRQVNRYVDHFNLELILAVGFRVRSRRGSQFRQWATDRLREYLVKGFTMDDERLKGKGGVVDYFDERLEPIRDIRASESRVFLMVRNIFAARRGKCGTRIRARVA